MRKTGVLGLLIICLPVMQMLSQDGFRFPGWDNAVVSKANTGAEAEFLKDDEKKVLLLTNLARADGPLFAETILKQYMVLKELKNNSYIRSLVRDLKNARDLPMLIPEKDLYDVAREHATRAGIRDYQGHKGFKKRYESVMDKYLEVGENIYYGNYTAEEIVIQLLIDEGIEDLGHRKNLLNPRFNSLGVAIKPHKSFQYNCVMSFGFLPRTYKDYIQ
jgi:uncharacterized protein YkwD